MGGGLRPVVIALVIVAIAVLVLGRNALDFVHLLLTQHDPGHIKSSDFDLILCGGRHLEAPYSACLGRDSVSGFIYPPPAALYAHVINLGGQAMAFGVQTVISLVVLVAILIALLRMAPSDMTTVQRFALMLGCAALGPVDMTLVSGHLNILVLAGFVGPLWLLRRSRPGFAGLILGLGFWLKIYPIIQFPLLVLRRRDLRSVALLLAPLVVLPVLLLPWLSPQTYAQFFFERLPPLQARTVPGFAQSIAPMVLALRAGSVQVHPVFLGVLIPAWLQVLIRGVLVVGVALAALHQRALKGGAPLEPLALLLGAVLLYAPIAWGHHFVLALPLVWVGLARLFSRDCGWFGTVMIVVAWMALLLPSWMDPPTVLLKFPGATTLFLTRYPLAVLALMGATLEQRRANWRVLVSDLRKNGIKAL